MGTLALCMKSRFARFLSFLLVALLSTACQKSGPTPTEAVLFQAIQDNLHAMEKKDLDAVMATIHPKTPTFNDTREYIGEFLSSIAQTDVKYTLSDLHVIHATGDEARVSFVQRLEIVGGHGDIPSNIVHGVHTLRPDGGKWKMYRTVQTEVTGLDGKPVITPDFSAAEPAPASPAAAPGTPESAAPPAEPPAPSAPVVPATATPGDPVPKPGAPTEKSAQ